jgi:hypothetical protein
VAIRGTPLEKVATASVLEVMLTESARTPLKVVMGVKPAQDPWKLVPVKVTVVSDG